jgi:hypothetical protein
MHQIRQRTITGYSSSFRKLQQTDKQWVRTALDICARELRFAYDPPSLFFLLVFSSSFSRRPWTPLPLKPEHASRPKYEQAAFSYLFSTHLRI